MYTNTPGYAKASNSDCTKVRAKLGFTNPATGPQNSEFGPLVGPGKTSQTGLVTPSWVTSRGAEFAI